MKYKKDLIEIVTTDLRALLWWASVGVKSAKGGTYAKDIENIIESYSDYLGMKIDKTYKFRKQD